MAEQRLASPWWLAQVFAFLIACCCAWAFFLSPWWWAGEAQIGHLPSYQETTADDAAPAVPDLSNEYLLKGTEFEKDCSDAPAGTCYTWSNDLIGRTFGWLLDMAGAGVRAVLGDWAEDALIPAWNNRMKDLSARVAVAGAAGALLLVVAGLFVTDVYNYLKARTG